MDPAPGYLARMTAEGHSKLEIICCLKRYLGREVYDLLKSLPGSEPTLKTPQTP